MVSLIEFSKGVKELIYGKVGDYSKKLVDSLKDGQHCGNFEFAIDNGIIRVATPIKDVNSVFEILNRAQPQERYELMMKGIFDGESKSISKMGSNNMSINEVREAALLGRNTTRIFYEIITADDFEIRKSEMEDITIKCKDKDEARRLFQLLVGIFPFVDIERETKRVKVACEFNVSTDDREKKRVLENVK